MKIDKLTEQILEITNNSDYGWIHLDSADAERIRLVLTKALSLGAIVGRSEQFYCDQEKTIKRCKNQCMRCNKLWKPKKQ